MYANPGPDESIMYQKENKKEKILSARAGSGNRKQQGKHDKSDDSSVETCSSSNSGGGKESIGNLEDNHSEDGSHDMYHTPSIEDSSVTRISDKDYGKAFHAFITKYANGNKYKTESEPLDATEINQLKSSGTLVVMTVLFQLGRNCCTMKSAEYSDMYVNAVSTEFFGCISERVYDAPVGNSILCCFPITPMFLLFFLDRSSEDLNSQRKWLKSKYRQNISERIKISQQ
jgi:hypothetical protein